MNGCLQTAMKTKITSEGEKAKLYVRVEPMSHPTRSVDPALSSIAYVNDDEHPILINNEHFTGHLVFRVRNFNGWTPVDEKTGLPRPPIPDCPHYFEGHKRSFSLQISGRFRRQWNGDDIMFGTFFDKKLNLPRGSGLALAFAQRIDPSMEYEMYSDTPFICSPILCAMNTVHIQPLLAPDPARLLRRSANNSAGTCSARSSLFETALRSQDDPARGITEPLTLPEWTYGGKHEILDENLMAAWSSWTVTPSTHGHTYGGNSSTSIAGGSQNSSLIKAVSKTKTSASHRRQWFLDERHRRRFQFHPDTVYSFDFASPYVDMNQLVLKLGININAAKYLDGQPVRYECRTRDGSILFWAVELGLV